MTRPALRKTPAFIVTAAAWLVLVALGLAACGKSDKAAEDTAAIRTMMEKEQKEKARQDSSMKEFTAGMRRGAAAPIRDYNAEAKAAKATSKAASKAH